jgi:lipopolysaccharide export LptBFGC system permease protein LptF
MKLENLRDKVTEFVMEEAKRLSFLLACIVFPLAVVVFGSLLFE